MQLERYLETSTSIRILMSKKLELLKKKLAVKIKLAQVKAAKALAEVIPDVIKLRTRQEGEGVSGKLKPLSDSYIAQRKGDVAFATIGKGDERKVIPYKPSKAPDLHPDTTPETSNLTATGQLIDAVQGKSAGSKVTIDIKKGKRKGELSGGKSTLSNQQVRKYVEDNGREFLELSKQERIEAEEFAKEIILKEIKEVFNS